MSCKFVLLETPHLHQITFGCAFSVQDIFVTGAYGKLRHYCQHVVHNLKQCSRTGILLFSTQYSSPRYNPSFSESLSRNSLTKTLLDPRPFPPHFGLERLLCLPAMSRASHHFRSLGHAFGPSALIKTYRMDGEEWDVCMSIHLSMYIYNFM